MVFRRFSDLSSAAARIVRGSLFFFQGLLEHFGFISITVNAYAWSCRLPADWLMPFFVSSALGTSLQVVITWFSAFDDVCGRTSLHL